MTRVTHAWGSKLPVLHPGVASNGRQGAPAVHLLQRRADRHIVTYAAAAAFLAVFAGFAGVVWWMPVPASPSWRP
jgi:hypothetical protein